MQLVVSVLVVYLLWAGVLGEYTHCKRVDENVDYKLYWDLSTQGKIKFKVQAETAGWLGLGLSTGGEHPMISNGDKSDVWIGWFDPESTSKCHGGCVYDYSVAQYQPPSLDPDNLQSLTLLSANYSEGVTTLEYIRDLDTNDTQYDRVIQPDSLTTFIWALNPSVRALPSQNGTGLLKHNADTKGVFTVKLSDPSSCKSTPDEQYSFTNEDGTYHAAWLLDGKDAIKFTITAQTKGWIGIGFSKTLSMIDADVYVGWIDPSGKAIMTDRYASAHRMPQTDAELGGINSVLHVESAEDGDDGVTSITFSRPLAAQDKYDVAITEEPIYVLWAYGSDSSVDYVANTFKKHADRGGLKVQLLEGKETPNIPIVSSKKLMDLHGILMVVSFCFLLFPGMLVSRYFKVLIPKWFHIHASTQSLGFGGIVLAFAFIFAAKNSTFEAGTHQIMGLVAFGAFAIQFALGLLTYFKKNQKPTMPPVWPHKIHWWLGWGSSAWTIITIYFGLRAYGAATTVTLVYGVWVGVAIAVVVALQNMIGQTFEQQNKYVHVELNPTFSLGEGEDDEKPDKHDMSNAKQIEDTQYKGKFSKPMLALYLVLLSAFFCLIVGLVLQARPKPDATPNKSTFEMSFQFADFQVPNKSTNYICKAFYLPNETDYHVIGFDPIKDNQEFLHHMILYETKEWTGDKEEYFDCSDMPDESTPLFAWAVGGPSRVMPPNVGFRIGKNAGKYVALQIHYDNPNLWGGRTDSSGVKLTITTEIREMDAGYFVTGVATYSISIPPGEPYYEIIGSCDTTQMFKGLQVIPEYTILSTGLHMHMTGHQGYTEQFRTDPVTNETASTGIVVCEDFYSFNNQRGYPTNSTLRPGDKFITHCMFDTTSKTTVTKGCEATSCEMCLNFMIYYPKVPNTTALGCGSKQINSTNTVKTMHCT